MNKILVDSGALFVMLNPKHADHTKTRAIANQKDSLLIVPYVVLTEVAFLVRRDGGIHGLIDFLLVLSMAKMQYEGLIKEDILRVREIMTDYRDAKFDFVDCCIMALSERLNITHVCTFDRRDFGIFRPKHVANLSLLP